MSLRWSEEALGAYEFLRSADGFEAVFDRVAGHVRRLESNPQDHRVGAQQRRIGKVWVWYVVVGTLQEQWLMSWTEEGGVVVIQSLDRLG